MSRSFGGIDAGRMGTAQNVAATTGTSAASTAFGAQTYTIRVAASAAITYRVGDATPTATTTDTLLPATWVDYVRVTPGQKLAALSVSGAATVNVTELTQ